jgi:branched-subunit amino acid aminotransferase/4-amino-4-deoxychorismate lyase
MNEVFMTIFDYAVVNGELVPLHQVQISLFHPAYFANFGVYETVKIDRGRPFYLPDHLWRLHHSAGILGITLAADIPTLAGWFERLHQVDPQATWTLRILALGALKPQEQPLIAMQADPLPTYPAEFYQNGARAILYEGQRHLPPCKSLNTLISTLARRRATEAGALEGLLHFDGAVTEGSRSNLFAVRKGQLLTPPTSQVLSGITRELVIQVMQATPYPVVEAPLPINFSLYEELFITSTSMHVMPLTQVNRAAIGNGQVGPITRLAMKRFNQHYQKVIGN